MRFTLENQATVNALIEEHGLEAAWKSLLAARVRASGPEFSYIVRAPEFKRLPSVKTDLLKDLSIGEISVLYEYALAYHDHDKRKLEGQYFTPDDVARFLAAHQRLFDKKTVWVDPCSGVGNLSYWLIKRASDAEEFLQKQLYLVDLDPLALLTARVIFTLEFQRSEKKLFNKLEKRCLARDFLAAKDLPKFDAAILNPPYVSGVLKATYRTAPTRNLYAYFLEKVASTCPAGYISITPQTFTNAARFSSLREVLLEKHEVLDVYCFDNVPDNIFSGIKFGSQNSNKANSTRAGIIVARRSREKRHRITPLLRWRSHERAQMLEMAEGFLTEVTFTSRIFPKLSRELRTFYDTVRTFEHRLEDLVVVKPSKLLLQVPTTPRYFISANKRPVQRTSYRTLYFRSERERDHAYILLNSSYMYWWWRVHDGGMTISEKTLLELPIPDSMDLSAIKSFVKKLEASEKSSKVTKLNAGKVIENIKHPRELISSITRSLFPTQAPFLSGTHANSHLS